MNKSEDIKELAIALCKAQAMMGIVLKDSSNPFFKSKYADLNAYLKVIKEPLADNGLSVVQLPAFNDGAVYVETVLIHVSGQWLSGTIGSPLSKVDAQGVGSAVTYCRRYGLAAILSLGAEDDDGNHASQPKPVEAPVKPRAILPLPIDVLGELSLLIKERGISSEVQASWLKRANVTALHELSSEQAGKLIKMLRSV